MSSASAHRLLLDTVRLIRAAVVPAIRETGDVRRNAVLWLARLAGTSKSSFEEGLRPIVDSSRIGELPYLAAFGYLVAAGVVRRPIPAAILESLGHLAGRSPHTAERTGYADDALSACGLLLLAREAEDSEFAERIRAELEATPSQDALVRAVTAVSTKNPMRPLIALDDGCPQAVAAGVLVYRIDPGLARATFSGISANAPEHLIALLARADFEPTADFGSMVVLAALEAVVGLPDTAAPSSDGPCDVGIVVALKEEFRVLHERFGDYRTIVEDGGRSYYVFEVPTASGPGPCRCVATLIGDMGTNRAAIVSGTLRERWEPAVTALVGIAAGVHDDVKLGDVIIASQVDNYLEAAKATDGPSGAEFRRANDSFKADHELVDRVRNFEFANPELFRKWKEAAGARRKRLSTAVAPLADDGLIRDVPEQKEGHVASGPLVVTSGEFLAWLRTGDRTYLAVEMEAGGVMLAEHMRPGRGRALVVRGISDFGDRRKSSLDKVGEGVLRRYAMENAVDFLWALVEAGVLPRTASSMTAPVAASAGRPPCLKEALWTALVGHANSNGEVTAPWDEVRAWLGPGVVGDVHLAAIQLKEDGRFSSTMFEYGPDGLCNVTLRRPA